MKKKIPSLALCLVMTSSAALAQTATVFGNYDCGQWIRNSAGAKNWLLGYLSGINMVAAGVSAMEDARAPGNKPKDPLGKLNSANQAFLWMDTYCRANPLKKVDEGALTLYRELVEK